MYTSLFHLLYDKNDIVVLTTTELKKDALDRKQSSLKNCKKFQTGYKAFHYVYLKTLVTNTERNKNALLQERTGSYTKLQIEKKKHFVIYICSSYIKIVILSKRKAKSTPPTLYVLFCNKNINFYCFCLFNNRYIDYSF